MAISVYSDEHKLFVTALWDKGISCANIADMLFDNYGLDVSRLAIIGLARRLSLTPRGTNGKFRQDGAARRPTNLAAKNGRIPVPPKKLPVLALPVPSEEPIPTGPIGDYPESGCQWIWGDVQVSWQMCAATKADHSNYCPFHAAKAKGATPRPMLGSSRAQRVIR